ncbi:MAG TPA: hypothetical protein VKV05_12700 [Terriglobales bacterium]|nr:hypothetical protein [Terriglobales bacterium]
MSLSSGRRFVVLVAVTLAALLGAWQSVAAVEPIHATTGVVKKIDTHAKTIAVETADGTVHVFKYTERTTVEGLRDVAAGTRKGTLDAYHGTLEGSHAVVRYTEKGGEDTAVGVKDVGKGTVKAADGTIDRVDKTGRTLTVKTKDGTEETYDVSKDASIDTARGVVNSAKWTYKKGDKVTVHYTEEAGKKVAYFIHHL